LGEERRSEERGSDNVKQKEIRNPKEENPKPPPKKRKKERAGPKRNVSMEYRK